MATIDYKFSRNDDTGFAKTLYARVNQYFKENNLSRSANSSMLQKTFLTFGFYMGIYFLILFGGINNIVLLFLLWMLLGLGQGFVGMCIMHDKVHGAYVDNKFLNLLLEIPIVAIGVETMIWKIEHNIMHHNYTNINGLDQDIHPRFVFRFSKHQPRWWFHRYQHIYATFLYGLLIIEWMTVKDFVKVVKYRKMGFFKSHAEALLRALIILLKKSVFYIIFLVIPLYTMSFHPLLIVAMFTSMLVVSGIYMTLVFQMAHVVPTATFLGEQERSGEENWHEHQMNTTTNFSNGSKLATYILGGLNYQIEHHLFPNMCHVHYPQISGIVKSTAEEFGLPYHSYPTFWHAIRKHYSLLKELGK